jgi:hypothetical protein
LKLHNWLGRKLGAAGETINCEVWTLESIAGGGTRRMERKEFGKDLKDKKEIR